MPSREDFIWGGMFSVSLFFGVYIIIFPPAQPLSPYAGDVLGSMIGFMLAISFAELVKLDDKRDRAKKIEADIRDEITDNLVIIDKVQHTLASDIWEMALSTGDIGLLDSDIRRLYSEHYRHVKYHRRILDTIALTEPVGNKNVNDKLTELMLVSQETIRLTGERALKENK